MDFFHPDWPVFYEDNHLLVLYKPAGLIMQRGSDSKPNLVDAARAWIRARYAKPGNVFTGMVHRLDAPVAGVMVLARTSKAAARLSAQFRDKLVQKVYLAVVQGRPPKTNGRLRHWIERSGRLSRLSPDRSPAAREAVLNYSLVDSSRGASLLEVRLETGRRHQIRLQLAALGCPILGDVSYGADQAMPHGRIALLSRHLMFAHPTRHENLEFTCPLPLGWPWPQKQPDGKPPLWTLEEYEQKGLRLPEEAWGRV